MLIFHNRLKEKKREHLLKYASYASVSVAATLIIIKLFAWIVTGSVSLQATLIDSLLDSLASVINLIAVYHATAPADKEHRFGHGKAEALGALSQTVFITLSALWLFYEVYNKIINPSPITESNIGVIIMIISIVLTLVLISFQRYIIGRTNSAAIKGDSIHYQSDLIINIGVILALVLSKWLNMPMIDPIIAGIIALYILYTAAEVLNESIGILMDAEFPDAERKLVTNVLDKKVTEKKIKGYHELKTRTSGPKHFIQVHLDMDGNINLYKAHEIAEEIEEEIKQLFPDAEIITHQDPA